MSDVEISRTESLTRQQAARKLTALAAALEDGGHVKVELGASTVKMHIPDHVRCEIEVEVDGDEVELEVELKWSTTKAPEPKPDSASPARTRTARRASAKA